MLVLYLLFLPLLPVRSQQCNPAHNCTAIGLNDQPVQYLNTTAAIGSLCSSVFDGSQSCLSVIARASGWTQSQLNAFRSVLNDSLGTPAVWSVAVARDVGVLSFGFDVGQFETLPLDDDGFVQALTAPAAVVDQAKLNGMWSAYKAKNSLNSTIYLTNSKFGFLKKLICGMTETDIQSITVQYNAHPSMVGELECLDDAKSQLFKDKALELYGDVETWNSSSIRQIGKLIAFLGTNQLLDLSVSQLTQVSTLAISAIPAANFKNFSAGFLNNLTSDQVQALTQEQFDRIQIESVKASINGRRATPFHTENSTASSGTITTSSTTGNVSAAATTVIGGAPPTTATAPGGAPPTTATAAGGAPPTTTTAAGGTAPTPTATASARPNTAATTATTQKTSELELILRQAYSRTLERPTGNFKLPPNGISIGNVNSILTSTGIPTREIVGNISQKVLGEMSGAAFQKFMRKELSPSAQIGIAKKAFAEIWKTKSSSNKLPSGSKLKMEALVSNGLFSEESFQNLHDDDKLEILEKTSSRIPRLKRGELVKVIVGLLNRTASNEAKEGVFKKIIPLVSVIPGSTFKEIINHLDLDGSNKFIFKYVKLTPKQRRMFTKLSPISATQPAEVAEAVRAMGAANARSLPVDQVQSLSEDACLSYLKVTGEDVGNEEEGDSLENGRHISISERKCGEKIRSQYAGSLKTMPKSNVETLIGVGSVTPREVHQLDAKLVCTTNREKWRNFNHAGCLAMFEKCSSTLGEFRLRNVAAYRSLLRCVPASTYASVPTEEIWSVVNHVSSSGYLFSLKPAQIEALGQRLAARLTSASAAADLKDGSKLMLFGHFVPRLDPSLLNKIGTASQRKNFCENIASCAPFDWAISQTPGMAWFKACRATGAALLGLSCLKKYSIGSMLSDISESELKAISNTELSDACESLQGQLKDQSARKYLASTVLSEIKKRKSSLSDDDLELLGTSIGDLSSAERDALPDSGMRNMLESMARTWNNHIHRKKWLKTIGFPESPDSRDEVQTKRTISERIRRAKKKTSSRRRRKRSSEALTCQEIRTLGESVVFESSQRLSTIPTADFTECVMELSSVDDWDLGQLKTLAQRAVLAYNGIAGLELRDVRGITSGLITEEMTKLNLNTIEKAAAIGTRGIWTAEKLQAAWKELLQDMLAGSVSSVTGSQLSAMGQLACGASDDDIGKLATSAFCQASHAIGQLTSCEPSQLMQWAHHAKHVSCFGPSASWAPSVVSNVGTVIGGLTGEELSKLSAGQIAAIPDNAFGTIPDSKINSFSLAQLKEVTDSQFKKMTSGQYRTLEGEKKTFVKQKLEIISPQLLKTIGAGCGILEASAFMIVTGFLVAILRI